MNAMDTINPINTRALAALKAHRHRLTSQQCKTLRGQILAGQSEAALRGLQKILERKPSRDSTTRQGS